MIYLLDTDTIIYLIRGMKIADAKSARQHEWQATGRRIFETAQKREFAGHEIALSALTVAELEFGARNSSDYAREMEIVRRVFTPFSLLDFDAQDCAARYGEIRHELESAGQGIGGIDTLIAAHALAIGAILVSNNLAEFMRVPGLKVENWSR